MTYEEFINSKIDYILFIQGLAFILLSGTGKLIGQQKKNTLQWKWLGLFGLIYGLSKWLELLIISTGDNNIFFIIRLIMEFISCLFLLEFWRTGIILFNNKTLNRYLFIPLPVMAFSGYYYGLPGLHNSVHYILELISMLLCSLTLWNYRRLYYPSRSLLAVTSIAMALLAVFNGIVVSEKSFFPSSVINYETFFSFVKIPTVLIMSLLSVIILVSLWFHYIELRYYFIYGTSKKINIFSEHRLTLYLAFILIAGWFFTDEIGIYMENKEKKYILDQTKIAAVTIDVEKVKQFFWNDSDLNNRPYLEIKELITKIRGSNPQCRFVSLMGFQDNKLYVLVDSEPQDSEDYSPPGQLYEEGDPRLIDFYRQKEPMVIGPVYDRWGSWISAYVHLYKTPDPNRSVALAIDFDATYWRSIVAGHRLAGIIIVLLFSILLCVFFVYQQAEESLRIRTGRSLQFRGTILNLTKSDKINLDHGIKQITESVVKTLDVERTAIWLCNEDESEFVCNDLYCREEDKHKRGFILKKADYPEYFKKLETMNNIISDDVRTDLIAEELLESYLIPERITSMMDTPVFRNGKIAGILSIEEVNRIHRWTVEEQEFAVSLADMISLLLESEERHRAEEAEKERSRELEKRSRELETLLDSLPGFAFLKDSNLAYITANKIFCHMVGKTEAELVGKTDADLFPPDREKKYRLVEEIILFGEEPYFELEEEIIQDGEKIILTTKKVPLRDGKGSVTGLICLGFDITEKKDLENRLRQSQKMESIGKLAGGIAHDFNNILGIIAGYNELAMQDAEGNETICSKLEHSLKAARRGKELIQQILAFSRQEGQEIFLPDKRRGNETILLVDDEASLLKVGKEMLESLGYIVEIESSSVSALKLFSLKPDKYDLIITDYLMPQMTGIELAREILKIRNNTPVIICTGFDEILSRDQLEKESIKMSVLKPFTLNEITEKIRHVLDEQKLDDQKSV
ncbi:MAG: response regulator [Candidatus Eremiobacterota bacterium]